jgi:murein DD-endopeptidase MepM/ murein hydrolase activator NlpD
MLVRVVTFG